jgi:hypothetical protein
LDMMSHLDISSVAPSRPYPHSLRPYGGSIYDRELKRVKESHDTMSRFIEGQQKWLNKMKTEVMSASVKRPVYT